MWDTLTFFKSLATICKVPGRLRQAAGEAALASRDRASAEYPLQQVQRYSLRNGAMSPAQSCQCILPCGRIPAILGCWRGPFAEIMSFRVPHIQLNIFLGNVVLECRQTKKRTIGRSEVCQGLLGVYGSTNRIQCIAVYCSTVHVALHGKTYP